MKSIRIQNRKATKQRRKNLQCKVYTIKVDKSKLSEVSKKHLHQLFLEAKWFYNFVVSNKDLKQVKTTITNIPVHVFQEDTEDYKIEYRDLNSLSSQMKQGIYQRTWDNKVSLARKRDKALKEGRKPETGKLQFKSKVRSIPLKQHNNTYTINLENNTIKLQGLKQQLKVRGLEQISKDCEIASAVLYKFQDNYYFKITTFQIPEKEDIPEKAIGIDFGCSTQMTLSNGIKIEYEFPISEKIKKLDRKIKKKNRKDSKNKYKDGLKREKEYQEINNQKDDVKHKIVNILTKNYKYVIIQDENVKAWQAGNHGKKINSTGIGGIIVDLKHKSHTLILVERFFPSTQTCSKCGHKHKLTLEERTYVCEKCGYTLDRDLNAARNIGQEGLKNYSEKLNKKKRKIPTEHRELKLEEMITSATDITESLKNISGVRVSYCR